MRWFWVTGLAGACTAVTIDEFETCSIELTPVAETVIPGEVVSWVGGPLTEVRDTRVTVGGVDAVVLDVVRSECDGCDACLETAGCTPCGSCDGAELEVAQRVACFGDPFAGTEGECGTCVETLTFEIPVTLLPGPAAVWMVNRHGIARPLEVVISGASGSTGHTGDTGGSSAGGSGATTDSGGSGT